MFIEPAAQLLLVAVLLTAAGQHVTHSAEFERLLAAQSIWPARYLPVLRVGVPFAEAAVGVALFLGSVGLVAPQVGALLSTALFSTYSVYLLILLRYRPDAPCACSSTEERVTAIHVARAVSLAALSIVCTRLDGAPLNDLDGLQVAIVVAAGLAGASIAWALPSALADPWRSA